MSSLSSDRSNTVESVDGSQNLQGSSFSPNDYHSEVEYHNSSSGEETSSGDYYDDKEQQMGEVSSDSTSRDSASDKRHKDAVRREEKRVLQRKLFHEDKGFVFNVDTSNAIKRVLKEKIYPKIKILSGTEQDYLTPDFVGDTADQSRLICEKLIHELDIDDYFEDKIRFWITYRKLVKNQLVKYRSNCVEDLKKEYLKGMIVGIFCNILCCKLKMVDSYFLILF
jgi:hypothetical protein